MKVTIILASALAVHSAPNTRSALLGCLALTTCAGFQPITVGRDALAPLHAGKEDDPIGFQVPAEKTNVRYSRPGAALFPWYVFKIAILFFRQYATRILPDFQPSDSKMARWKDMYKSYPDFFDLPIFLNGVPATMLVSPFRILLQLGILFPEKL
jgi:hypothetical protein